MPNVEPIAIWKGYSWPKFEPNQWVLQGDYPPDVVWVFIEKSTNGALYRWYIVYANRDFACGQRHSFQLASRAALNALSRPRNRVE